MLLEPLWDVGLKVSSLNHCVLHCVELSSRERICCLAYIKNIGLVEKVSEINTKILHPIQYNNITAVQIFYKIMKCFETKIILSKTLHFDHLYRAANASNLILLFLYLVSQISSKSRLHN